MDLDEHRVRVRAYYIWEDEGRVFGQADAHWLRAEAELRAGPAIVQASAEAVSLAPSPAKVLKTRASRAKATADAVVDGAAKPAATSVSVKPAAGKAAAAKPATTAKPSATAKSAASKAASKAAPRTARKAPAAGVALH